MRQRAYVVAFVGALLLSACPSVAPAYRDADAKEYMTVAAVVSRYAPVMRPEDVRLLRENLASWKGRLLQAGAKEEDLR